MRQSRDHYTLPMILLYTGFPVGVGEINPSWFYMTPKYTRNANHYKTMTYGVWEWIGDQTRHNNLQTNNNYLSINTVEHQVNTFLCTAESPNVWVTQHTMKRKKF